jgi:hypothetical protein
MFATDRAFTFRMNLSSLEEGNIGSVMELSGGMTFLPTTPIRERYQKWLLFAKNVVPT